MRGSKAKKLRRAAKNQTVGMPTVSYDVKNHSRQVRRRSGKVATEFCTSATMVASCTRSLYKLLKRAA